MGQLVSCFSGIIKVTYEKCHVFPLAAIYIDSGCYLDKINNKLCKEYNKIQKLQQDKPYTEIDWGKISNFDFINFFNLWCFHCFLRSQI